jgi:hypothetical protein
MWTGLGDRMNSCHILNRLLGTSRSGLAPKRATLVGTNLTRTYNGAGWESMHCAVSVGASVAVMKGRLMR